MMEGNYSYLILFFFLPSLAKHVSICLNFTELYLVVQARQLPERFGVSPAAGFQAEGTVMLQW